MSRWTKNIVVPLESLCKEKESTNRPTVTRSVGTVGKWGKMGFTSTRTYALSGAVAAAAAAVASSPSESPASILDDDLSPSVPEPPKPKKFFKSRSIAPPEVIVQYIAQNLPRHATSPIRDANVSSGMCTPARENIKVKMPKTSSSERKKKPNKKQIKTIETDAEAVEEADEENSVTPKTNVTSKSKKKKEEKKLKPEAPPSRVIARARKAVNYCEDDEEERIPTPIKDYIIPKNKDEKTSDTVSKAKKQLDLNIVNSPKRDIDLPPPASKTPEHPPIVLRISKGTSRLVSTDSEDQQNNTYSPDNREVETSKSRKASVDEGSIVLQTTPKIIVKPPKPPSPEPEAEAEAEEESLINDDETPEINYCTVKISPDKPPKERLKLIIKTDVIRNALAKAAAAKAASAAEKAANSSNEVSERPEKEKKQKSKKHKHQKQSVPATVEASKLVEPFTNEFKTPSPHPTLATIIENPQSTIQPQVQAQPQQPETTLLDLQQPQISQTTIKSPATISERDFDSQSSVLGSISSKGNQTPLPQSNLEESCVLRSRGSSVITSDLDSSQHSSLVAAPSDIESRLESMMMSMDGEVSQRASIPIDEEPLQEDILAVLRGDESEMGLPTEIPETNSEVNDLNAINNVDETNNISEQDNVYDMNNINNINNMDEVEDENQENIPEDETQEKAEQDTGRRVTRGRGRGITKAMEIDNQIDLSKNPGRSRARKPVATQQIPAEDVLTNKRATRRCGKKTDEQTPTESGVINSDETEVEAQVETDVHANNELISNAVDQQDKILPLGRRGRSTKNNTLNNNFNNNNNNINKIAASLSAKAGAVEDAKLNSNINNETNPIAPRTYGRKRKNQQVTQVIQPSAAEIEEHLQPIAAKVQRIDLVETNSDQTCTLVDDTEVENTDVNKNENDEIDSRLTNKDIIPAAPIKDYQIKDKFKRTLTLDPQANCNAIVETKAANVEENNDEEQRGGVKLVISKKKGSIFKSRALVGSSDQQEMSAAKRYLYKHRWDADANGEIESDGNVSPNKTNDKSNPSRSIAEDIFNDFDEDIENVSEPKENIGIGKFTRITKPNPQGNGNQMDCNEESDTITSVRIDRQAKEFYMVVKNVKTAHQIQEIGEYQEMDDDVEYILDALKPQNPIPTRCLSALQLATKCMIPAFRMHVRAHGIVTKFFKALSDANNDLSLGLCTSTVMFILSQEGLNMDLDRDSLELMINLLEAESVAATPADRAVYERNKQKVRELCEDMKAQGKAAHLNVDSISVGTLAMETLLSLTSKRAGEWFKEELRVLGGLEHIIKTISDSGRTVFESNSIDNSIQWTLPLLENLQTVERCMRVLENVTQMNEENQRYMLTHDEGGAIDTLCSLYSMCERQIMLNPTNEATPKDEPGVVLRTLLISVLKVLVNLTHSFFDPSKALGAELLGKRADLLDTSYHLLLRTPNYIPDRCIFELSILVLLLLINLTAYTIPNRTLIMKSFIPPEYGKHQRETSAVEAIMEYFYKCEELARLVEKNTDAYLDNTDKSKKKQEEVDETVNNLLQKAGHHMEHTLKGSYAAILIGQLITDSDEYENIIRTHLRNTGFQDIIAVLEKYYNFMNLTASSEATAVAHIKETKKLIAYFKKRDLVYEMNQSDDNALPLNLEKTHSNAATSDREMATSSFRSSPSHPQNSSSSHSDLGPRVYKTYSQR